MGFIFGLLLMLSSVFQGTLLFVNWFLPWNYKRKQQGKSHF